MHRSRNLKRKDHDQDQTLLEHEALPRLVAPQADDRKFQISYINVAIFGYEYVAALYGAYLLVSSARWVTVLFAAVNFYASLMGAHAGAHRLWSHRSYQAKLPLQLILILFNTLAGQYTAFYWARDHRLHHRYSDTDADPYNAARGFFFSHIGWLLVVRHPEVKARGAAIDVSDLWGNPVVAFQRRHAWWLFTLICHVLPTVTPVYFWGETFSNAWHINAFRLVSSANCTFLINSAAHTYGTKPYDRSIMASQNSLVTVATLGEGFHNYHHVFPRDYRAAEFGDHSLNLTTKFIDFFARIGWAYDLRTVDPDSIAKRAGRTGDGTYPWESEQLGPY